MLDLIIGQNFIKASNAVFINSVFVGSKLLIKAKRKLFFKTASKYIGLTSSEI
jgi:hypothetical protein